MPTRPSYLESYFNIIPESQKKKLLEIIKSKYTQIGEDPSIEILQGDLERIIARLDEPLGDPHTKYRKAMKHGKISSKDYNDMMDEIYVDLWALFDQDNIIDKAILTNNLVNKATIVDIRSGLKKIADDIKVNTIIKENKSGITDAKFDSFYKDNNQSKDPIFKSWIDTSSNTCKLAKGLDQSALSVNGLAAADIYLRHLGGGVRGTIASEDHRKEKAIDGSLDTFWGEVFLTDEPIVQTYEGSEYFGAICEVTIKFFRKELINYIRYDPFTNYPLKIIKIKYRPDGGASWLDLTVGEKYSISTIEYNFSEVEAKEVMIVINQENPSVNTYMLPKTTINNAEMWQQIADRELSVSTETKQPIQATQDMIDYISGWQAYSDAVGSYGKSMTKNTRDERADTIGESIFDVTTNEITKTKDSGANELKLDIYKKKSTKKDEMVEVRKYEYLYGAYGIDIKKIWYLDKGFYVGPKYRSNGSIVEAEIDVTEVIPSGTSIEYSLSTTGGDWRHVMPSGNYVNGERVDIDPETSVGILRFPTCNYLLDGLFRNQVLMPSGIPGASGGYIFNEDSNTVEIRDGWYVGTASYTASYTPKGIGDVVPSGLVVDFSEDPTREAQDIFEAGASRNYKVELTHNPYIDYRIINETPEGGSDPASPNFQYTEGRWYNRSGAERYGIQSMEYYDPFLATVDGYPAENRTDYYDDIRPALTEYSKAQYPYYEYFQVGRNIYFNTKIENKEIKVKYRYLNDFIQFRALLRNNNTSNVSRTPILEDYTLKLRTS